MLKVRSLGQPAYPQVQGMGQAPSTCNNVLPFILGMVTWGVFGSVLTGAGKVGQAAVLKGTSAIEKKLKP